MVTGFESFKRWFSEYSEQYTIIGGTACDLLMSEEGMDFRATRDIDMVLIVESLTPQFGERFWSYIRDAGYEHRNKSTGEPQFYRFTNPKSRDYPYMIELFSRRANAIVLSDDAVLTPLPLDHEISSLSAILLDDAYYQFLREGKTTIDPSRSLAVIYHGDIKVIIPAEEAVEPPEDFRGRLPEDVLHYMVTKRLGAEVDYIIKGIDAKAGVAVGSRLEQASVFRSET